MLQAYEGRRKNLVVENEKPPIPEPPNIQFNLENGQDIAKTVDLFHLFWFSQAILVRLNVSPALLSNSDIIEYSTDLGDFTVQGRSKVYRVEDQVYSAIVLTPKVNVHTNTGVFPLTKESGTIISTDTPISSFKLVTHSPRCERTNELRVNLVVRCSETKDITSPTAVTVELDLLDSKDFKENIIFSRDDVFLVCRSFCVDLVSSQLLSVTEEGGTTAWVIIKPYKSIVLTNGLCIGEGVLLNETNIVQGISASDYQGRALFGQVIFTLFSYFKHIYKLCL